MSADAKDEPEPWRLSSRGRLTRLSGEGLTETRCYDGRGWVTQVANVEEDAPEAEVCGSVAEPLQAFAYEYDGRGNRTKETWTSGAVSEQTTYAYDLADRLTGVAYPSGPTVLYDLAADGTRLGEKHLSSGPPTLSFETTAGLTKHLEYLHNTAGQLGTTRDALTQTTVATLGYDAAGRTTSWAQNGQTRTYTWDVEDRLRGVDWSGWASASYDYDHSGKRLSATAGELTTRFVWGAGELLEEQAPGGTVHRYLREGELVVGVSDERVLHDALGTIVGRRSAAGVVASHRFDAWGNYNASTAPPSGEGPTIGYTGHHVDTLAGLTYAKARWYAPELGRFLSTDPLGVTADRLNAPLGLGSFLYVSGNPVRYVDPDGRMQVKLGVVVLDKDDTPASIWFDVLREYEVGLFPDYALDSLGAALDEIEESEFGDVSSRQMFAMRAFRQRAVNGVWGKERRDAVLLRDDIKGHSKAFSAEVKDVSAVGRNVVLGAVAFTIVPTSSDEVVFMFGGKVIFRAAKSAVKQVSFILRNAKSVDEVERLVEREGLDGVTRVGDDYVHIVSVGSSVAAKEVKWTAHGGKHVASARTSWNKVVASTKSGPAKYLPGTNIEALERSVWMEGNQVTNGKPWRVMEFGEDIGASGGKPSRWIRVEESGGTIHGHPITATEYRKLTR